MFIRTHRKMLNTLLAAVVAAAAAFLCSAIDSLTEEDHHGPNDYPADEF